MVNTKAYILKSYFVPIPNFSFIERQYIFIVHTIMYLLKYIVPDSDIQAPGRNKQYQLSYSVVGHVNYKIYVLDRKYPFSCKSGITSMALASLSDWI